MLALPARRRIQLTEAVLLVAVATSACSSSSPATQSDGGPPDGATHAHGSGTHDATVDHRSTSDDSGHAGHHDAPTDSRAASTGDSGDDAPFTDAGTSPIPPGVTLIFTGDFETGDLSQWAGQYPFDGNPCVDGGAKSMTVYSTADAPTGAPPPRQGRYAVMFHTLNGDVAPCTTTDNPRTQLQTPDSLELPGDELWEQWSVYFPDEFPTVTTLAQGGYLLFQEDYGAPFNAPPALVTLAHAGITPPYSTPLVRGKWIDLYVHKKLSRSTTDGFVEAWVDGTYVPKIPFVTLNDGQDSGLGFYLSSYRYRNSVPTPVDLYLDNAFVYRVP